MDRPPSAGLDSVDNGVRRDSEMSPDFHVAFRRSNAWIGNADMLQRTGDIAGRTGDESCKTSEAGCLIGDDAVFDRDDAVGIAFGQFGEGAFSDRQAVDDVDVSWRSMCGEVVRSLLGEKGGCS